ncbi:MAG TPA: FAD-dependent oxidoreductase [Terriglobales bacterium]|nr:FAD-dependent oxidoreductase [Terriglobales bacterium]
MEIGILGGGLTGLTIASQLKNEFEVLEKNSDCGGLCRSLKENGFTFDYGGAHIIYSKDRESVDFMLKALQGNYGQGRRNNKIYYKGNFVKYPFENGLSDLPKEDNFECLYHYLKNDYPYPSNFEDWIYFTFGKGITERYLLPYNRKVWNTEPKDLSLHWVEGRIPKPPLEDVIKSAIGISTEGYTHQLNFFYPKQGGIQALVQGLEEKVEQGITRNFAVRKISRENNGWSVTDGQDQRKYDLLISTIPIFDLLKTLDDVPEQVKDASSRLQYNSLIAVLLGLEGNSLPPYTAIYFPDEELKFNRVGFPHIFSPDNAPSGHSSLVVEITAKENDPTWRLSDQELLQHSIQGLAKCGLLEPKKVCFKKVVRSKYAYVIYDKDYLKNIKIVKDYIEKLGIILCGRFAEFEYLNMDACVQRGRNLAGRINSTSEAEEYQEILKRN